MTTILSSETNFFLLFMRIVFSRNYSLSLAVSIIRKILLLRDYNQYNYILDQLFVLLEYFQVILNYVSEILFFKYEYKI